MGETTDWPALLRRAVGFGIGPEAFWRLSLAEWRMLTEPGPDSAPLARPDFERLLAAWPDGGEG